MKTTILFVLFFLCAMFVAPKAEAWWRVSTYPTATVSASQSIPQYEIHSIPVYDAYGNFCGYREEKVLVGYIYPRPHSGFICESFSFTIRSGGGHNRDRDDHHGHRGGNDRWHN